MVLGNHGRSITNAVFSPVARVLARVGVTPNMVTLTSAALAAGVAIGVIAQGHLLVGTLLIGVIMFADSLDGVLARQTGTDSPLGAFLDSTIDRVTDGIFFASLVWWSVFHLQEGPARTALIAAGLLSLVFGATVPYARARAESVGVKASVGIAERTDRLLVVAVGALLTGAGLTAWPLAVAFSWVAFASAVTVVQRVLYTFRALRERAAR